MSRLGRAQPIQPIALHGFKDPGPGPVGTTPGKILVVDRADQRVRYKPLDPVVISGAQFVTVAPPTATPPPPFVVPIDERRRFLAAIPPRTAVGFDDVTPTRLIVVEHERRRLLAPIPELSFGYDDVPPPKATIVEPARPRRIPPDALVGNSGLLAALVPPVFVRPPAPLSLDRVDQRVRYKPLDALVFSGVLVPFIPPPPGGTPLRTLLGVGT